MGRVDVVADPEPRVGEADRRRGEQPAQRLERAALRLADLLELLEPSRGVAVRRRALEPGLDQVVVVVAGRRSPPRRRHRPRRARRSPAPRSRAPRRSGRSRSSSTSPSSTSRSTALERLEQPLAKLRPAQQVGAAAEAEVQVGDDRGDHGRNRSRPSPTADACVHDALAAASHPGAPPAARRACSGSAPAPASASPRRPGIDEAVERTTEEAIVRALESPAVERAIIRVLESDAAQESLERTLSSPAVERAADQVLDSELVDHVWDRLLASDEVQKLVERIAEAPEVRAAIAVSGRRPDRRHRPPDPPDREPSRRRLERVVRRLLGKPRGPSPPKRSAWSPGGSRSCSTA